MTTKNAQAIGASIADLALAFELVIRLVNREVYEALARPPVDFSLTSPHGYIA